MPKDYYKTLGVDKNASAEEIKKAFRKLAHEFHPDKTGGDDSKFKEALAAYQVLSNEEKRKQYDQFGTTFDEAGGQGFGGFQGFDFNAFSGAEFADLSDVLGSMFGFGGTGTKTRGRARGSDIQKDIELTFAQSVFGVVKTIDLYRSMSCERCGGSGGEPGAKLVSCANCAGRGEIRTVERTVFGSVQIQQTCDECHGSRKKSEKTCIRCRGSGVSRELRKLEVKIPAGAEDGGVMRISGGGEAAPHGGASGDLYLRIRVIPDRRFERHGFDILSEAVIPFTTVALGGVVSVDTVHGRFELKIPNGSQPGAVFRLRGRGVPRGGRGEHGDHLVEITIEVPKKLSQKQKQLLEEFREDGEK